jgi:hypothetical protein
MSCMTTTTHTMVVELSHEVVVSFMRWLFREATTSFPLLSLSSTSSKKHIWHCMGRPMRLLTCTNVHALRVCGSVDAVKMGVYVKLDLATRAHTVPSEHCRTGLLLASHVKSCTRASTSPPPVFHKPTHVSELLLVRLAYQPPATSTFLSK